MLDQILDRDIPHRMILPISSLFNCLKYCLCLFKTNRKSQEKDLWCLRNSKRTSFLSLFNNKNIHEKNILMINGKPLSFHRCPRSWSISPHLPTNTPIPHHISANDTYWQWRYSGMYADQGLKEFHQWYRRQAATDWNTPHNSLLMLTLSSSIFLVSSGRKSSHFNLSKRRQGF